MFHIRRMLLLSIVIMTSLATVTSQKVDKDDLDKDKYNLEKGKGGKAKDSKEENAPQQNVNSKPLKYIVTEEIYLDFEINDTTDGSKPNKGHVVIACFGDITPITCLNFAALAKGHRSGRGYLTYTNTPVHRIVKDFLVQMGDVAGKKGKSGMSIYGDTFRDENFKLSHRGLGWVAMANHGRNTNASQFFILLQAARWLDSRHVVFGKVIKGMDTVRRLGELQTTITGRPKVGVKIVDSGVVGIASKYEIPFDDVVSDGDIAS